MAERRTVENCILMMVVGKGFGLGCFDVVLMVREDVMAGLAMIWVDESRRKGELL